MIESGSNQQYVFRSNRRRYAVGASRLVGLVGQWVHEAVEEAAAAGTEVDVIVATSSKALLLVPDAGTGRTIVEQVTRRALVDAPGVDIWGYVEPEASADPMFRLDRVHAAHAQTRWQRPTPGQRSPLAPFLDVCSVTGLAASADARDPGQATRTRPLSTQAVAALDAAKKSRADMARLLGETAVPDGDADELLDAGWIAVIHADGNDIGDTIRGLESTTKLREFSSALADCTRRALVQAAKRVADDHNQPRGWILPLIVAGDDLTVVCDARFALTFTRTYLTGFEKLSADIPALAAAATHLTAAAGLAYVKPHYPFSSAYALAHELSASAKTAKTLAQGRSAYDLHVLRDSTSRPLADVRASMASVLSATVLGWTATPLLAPPGVPDDTVAAGASEWGAAHEDSAVVTVVDRILSDPNDGPVTGQQSQRIRDGLRDGGAALDRLQARLAARHATDMQDALLTGNDGSRQFTRWPTVLDLVDVGSGTAAAQGVR